jgi:hypothetical protein
MITIRDRSKALSLSARASTADLQTGMIVVMVQGAASGDQPKVRRATAAEIQDVKVQKFIVEYDAPDSLEVDYVIDPATQLLTAQPRPIAVNAQVNIFMGILVIAYTEDVLPAGFKAANIRESVQMSYDATTSFPAAYSAGGTANGTDTPKGHAYRVDGPEVTFIVRL